MDQTITPLVRPCAALLLAAALLSGCATAHDPDHATAETPANPTGDTVGDPLEPLNRRLFAFNRTFDRHIAQPLARGYEAVTPEFVDRGVSNFFSNLDDVSVLVNSVLQLKGRKAAATTLRLSLNTTFGLLGLFDVASALGIPKEDEDFGQTLGYWGVGAGPYLVLPVLGPSTLRDGPARAVDAQYDPLREMTSGDEYYAAIVLYGIDVRAGLLGTTDLLDTAALDPYAYTRAAWLGHRASQVYDGNPPPGAVPGAAPPPADDGFDPFSNEDDDLFEEPTGDDAEP